jgi:hypothetical protein
MTAYTMSASREWRILSFKFANAYKIFLILRYLRIIACGLECIFFSRRIHGGYENSFKMKISTFSKYGKERQSVASRSATKVAQPCIQTFGVKFANTRNRHEFQPRQARVSEGRKRCKLLKQGFTHTLHRV